MITKSVEEVAWLAGIAACEQGIPRTNCPYLITGPQSAVEQWYEGYNLASTMIPKRMQVDESFQKDI